MKTKNGRELFINDVTLRDGEQAPGNGMNPDQKLKVAQQLQKLGINGVEAGFANASPEEFDSIQEIGAEVGALYIPGTQEHMRISSLARLVHSDIERALKSVQTAPHRGVHTFISTSDIQSVKFADRIKNMGGNPESTRDLLDKVILPGIEEELGYITKADPDAVIQFSPEDWTRTSDSVSDEVILAAAQNGASVINLPDTVGTGIPRDVFTRVRHAREILDANGYEHVTISWHGHNDTSQGVACAMEAMYAGAEQMESTILGIGERTGNFSFEGVMAATDANRKRNEEIVQGPIKDTIVRSEIKRTATVVSTIIGSSIPREHPIVGENAFAHESGIHQDGDQKGKNAGVENVYEILSPESYGAKSKLILGKHSGMAGLVPFFKDKQLPYRKAERRAFVQALSTAGEKRRKGLSDQEVMDQVYYPVIIEATGGAFITDMRSRETEDGFASVTITTREGNEIIGRAGKSDAGQTSAAINGMQNIIPHITIPAGGLDIHDTGGTQSNARIAMTMENGESVTRVLEHGNLEEAERLALIDTFNAAYALEAYKQMIKQQK